MDTSAHVDDTKGPVSSPVKNLSACKSQAISKGCYQKFIPDIQQSEMHILALTNDNIIVDYNADSGVVDLIYHRNSLYDKLLQLILERDDYASKLKATELKVFNQVKNGLEMAR